MPSLVPGFEYDVFISYRQKDNAYDGWVTEFVANLKKELDATFKEDISIYFDENPHHGLLETHDVDESLKGKLKCLIFIPIISQTFCDPKSFAWTHELLAFKKLASEDHLGLKVNVSGGNVASRILPVRIHELDAGDRKLLESELGPLRSIDFIFKSSGVNRPLRVNEEHQGDNINKTYYRDQINKVANAVKEIISGIAHPDTEHPPKIEERILKTPKARQKLVLPVVSILLILAASYLSYLYFKQAEPEELQYRSIAVLPFTDLSPGKDHAYLGDGVAVEIINALSQLEELKVIGHTSSFQFRGEKVDLLKMGKALDVTMVLEGSVMKSGDRLRVTAQLVNVNDGSSIWSDNFDQNEQDIIDIQLAIARSIAQKFTKGGEQHPFPTNNPQAYDSYLQGKSIHYNRYVETYNEDDYEKAKFYYQTAIQLDSTFSIAYAGLADLYDDRSYVVWEPALNYEQVKLAETAFRLNPNNAYVNFVRSFSFHTEIRDLDYELRVYKSGRRAYELAPNDPLILSRGIGLYLIVRGFPEYGNPYLEKALQYDPLDADIYQAIGFGNLLSGRYDDAERDLKRALTINRSHSLAITLLAYLNLLKGDLITAETYIEQGIRNNDQGPYLIWVKHLLDAIRGSQITFDPEELYETNNLVALHFLSVSKNNAVLKEWLSRIFKEKRFLRYTRFIESTPSFENFRSDNKIMELFNKIKEQQRDFVTEIKESEEAMRGV